MVSQYVLDACALAALINDEIGADIVQDVLEEAGIGNVEVYMNKLNLFEVYYGIRRLEGVQQAEAFYNMVLGLPIIIVDGISDDVFREAGRVKTQYKMSLADSIALGETSVRGATIVTSDHHEFDVVEQNEGLKFTWIR